VILFCWGRRDIHDDMTFKVIRGQGQGQEMTSVPIGTIFTITAGDFDMRVTSRTRHRLLRRM